MPQASVLLPPTRLRNTVSTRAPLTAAQKAERTEQSRIRQEGLNNAVEEWKKTTLTTAADVADRFGTKTRHVLDLFFQNGVHLVHKQSKINPHNTFLHMKAEELRENGDTPTLSKLHSEDFKEEYDNLNDDELAEIVARHEGSNTIRQRVSAKSRVQDVVHTFMLMQKLMDGLNMRVGVEGFFCIVRNSPQFHMEPKWYFSNQALMDYMKIAVPANKGWDLGYVSAKLEAFAIAGCNTINLRRTAKQRADEIKKQIREKIRAMLVEITANENATMYYVDYEEKIVQRYGVELIGWTHDKFVNPSELSTSIPALQQLLDAINTGSCKFVHLTPSQLNERRQEHQKAIDNGAAPAPKMRKPRKDRGTKRKAVQNPEKENDRPGNARSISKKRRISGPRKTVLASQEQPKSTETVESETSADEN